jgi:pantetheine-phosphate adenylyltransferase
MMKNAVMPGSFDPITNGHMDLIRRASVLFDHVTVLIAVNSVKKTMFTAEQRVNLARAAVSGLPNVSADSCSELVAEYVRGNGNPVIVKGARCGSDYEYELQIAQVNRELEGCETLILPCSSGLFFLSSTFVRELLYHGRPCGAYIPENAYELIKKYL